MSAINPLEIIFDACKATNKREYPNIEKTLLTVIEFLPKKSKNLSTNFFRKIFSTSENITLILLGHLYIERLLNEIITIKYSILNTDDKNIKFNSFYKKIAFLKKEGVLEVNVADDIITINELRNCFAHELNYQLSSFDLWKLSELKKYRREVFEPKNRKLKEIFTRLILKIYFFNLMRNLSSEFRFLHLINEQ